MSRRGSANPEKRMPITGHIQELQVRLMISAAVLITAATLAYAFKDAVINALISPLGGEPLIYLNVAGGFSFVLMVSVYAGLAAAAPVVIHQLYCFIRPTLPLKMQRYSLAIFISSFVLLLCGMAFGYAFAIPGALNFLYEFAGDYVDASLTADSYLNFIVAYTLGIGLVFQVPLLLLLIHWIKPLTPGGLMKSERWAIVLSFVAAAILTPTPDPLNQTIIAVPIIMVYQLGVAAVLVSIYRERRNRKKQKQPTAQSTPSPSPQIPASTPPTQPKPAITPQSASPKPARSVDGFGIRRPSALIAPTRPSPVQTSQAQPQPYRPNIQLDGISRTP